jgi:hypothetical protein
VWVTLIFSSGSRRSPLAFPAYQTLYHDSLKKVQGQRTEIQATAEVDARYRAQKLVALLLALGSAISCVLVRLSAKGFWLNN